MKRGFRRFARAKNGARAKLRSGEGGGVGEGEGRKTLNDRRSKEDVSPIPRCFAAILSSLVTVKRAFYGIEANFH